MSKETRQQVYDKYGGRCAYCGKVIEFKDMQVDHIKPKHSGGTDDESNLNPSCRSCNHYKRGNSLKAFRTLIATLHERLQKIYICKVAEDYGVIKVREWDGTFYFEKAGGEK